ncbi:MAG: hypothetical protein J5685_09300 [Clostridiales bacterium]|nr:hypothetical protein [Clostridiales bacterium]
MKLNKTAYILVIFLLTCCLYGCRYSSPETSGESVTQATEASADVSTASDTECESDTSDQASSGGVDIDLTTMSATMVYAEVYNMIYMPDDFVGKTVKMEGSFLTMLDEQTGIRYYGCVIQDATACCSQGLDFEVAGDLIYPDDFPAVGEDITVTGTYDYYMEGDLMYCLLRDCTIEF